MVFVIEYCMAGQGGINSNSTVQWTHGSNVNLAVNRLYNNYGKLPNSHHECYRIGEGHASVRDSNPRIRLSAPSKNDLISMAAVELNLPVNPDKIIEI